MKSLKGFVESFNATVGKEKSIIVGFRGFVNVDELGQSVRDVANKKVEVQEVPDIFVAYVDIDYKVDVLGIDEDLCSHFTEKVFSQYIPGYIEEGQFHDGLKSFLTAKSTEIMMLNMIDFN